MSDLIDEAMTEVLSVQRGSRVDIVRPADGEPYAIAVRYDGSIAGDSRLGDEIQYNDVGLDRTRSYITVTRRGEWWKR